MAVYFGGSRSLAPSQILASVAHAVLLSGAAVHVGCQFGADQQAVNYTSVCYSGQFNSSLFVFAVAPRSEAPAHVRQAEQAGAQVVYQAGGTVAPIKARYLLRSIAAFQGCSQAVFFNPGPGSLAVAREAVKAGIPVFAFQQEAPASIIACPGHWVPAQFMGFSCWQWSPRQSGQMSLI